MQKFIIAVDGYSSCGKSTFAKAIARHLQYVYIDTGAMYRAVTLYAVQKGFIHDNTLDAERLCLALDKIHIDFVLNPDTGTPEIRLNGSCVEHLIRSGQVADMVSEVSALAPVREHMATLQRAMGVRRGVVMDGRDIGTAIFPDADIKLFMTADSDIRAMRRQKEMQEKGVEASFEEIKANLAKRDDMDVHRAVSPLIQAEDAIVLDNSHMTLEDQMAWFEKLLKDKKA